jgi:ABC-type bacteriocin/lantibiotic exporter with double-glycine peptidase domain
MLATIAGWFKPFAPSAEAIKSGETLRDFVWRASGAHQFYVGGLAISVALLNFLPIDLQRRVVDDAIANKDVKALLVLGGLYLATVLLHSGAKYALMVYQGWVGESAIKTARDQLAVVACERLGQDHVVSGQTATIIGGEIDAVGGFVGTSISEFVVNVTLMVTIVSYMLYVQPVIALVSGLSLLPQIGLAIYMQTTLNFLVERQVTLVRELGNVSTAYSPSRSGMRRKAFGIIRTIFGNRIHLYLLKFGLKTLLNIASAIGSLVVLIVGGYLVIRGQTTLGTVVAFVSGFQRLSDPMGDLLDFYRVYSQAKVQYRMIVRWVAGDHFTVPEPQRR